MHLKIIGLISGMFMLPLGFGILLLLMFIAYVIFFAWLEIVPIFKGHFKIMSELWLLGLRIVFSSITWKLAGIGILILGVSPVVIAMFL